MDTHICPQCHQAFVPDSRKPAQTYCSRECWRLSRYRQVTRTCETCHQPFSVYQARSTARFCSWACRTTQIAYTCQHCGATFYDKASHTGKRLTCSRRCAALLRAAQDRSPKQGKTLTAAQRADISDGLRAYFADDPTKHWNYQGGTVTRRGQSWPVQRALARARDGYACVVCGRTEAVLGKQVSVHHRIPFRRFANSDEANHLDNLICTCQSCHMKLEHGKIPMPVIR